jgi:2,3,4,5-tetrahydropyridine-2-carboxylate N-succinyltransferase
MNPNWNELRQTIEYLWTHRDELHSPEAHQAVAQVIEALDRGALRVAEPHAEGWIVNEWIKKAVVLYFPQRTMETYEAGTLEFHDKMPLKRNYASLGVRVVPHAIARHGAYLAPGVILMPSYVNIGAHVGPRTMVDTWATVGSCAQIGADVHLSGGVGIGGVLEPMQAGPTIIEDDCFIGARSEVVEGCIVRQGSVLGMGVFIGQSTKIVDRETGAVMYGEVPAGSVVVAGSMPSKGGINLYCAVIVKRVDAQTRSKVSINELLRDD